MDRHEEGSGTIQFFQRSTEDIEEVSPSHLAPHSMRHAPLLEPPGSNLPTFALHHAFPISTVPLLDEVIRSVVLIPDHSCRFWFPFLVCIVLIAGMIIVSTPLVPYQWQLTGNGWAVILPLASVLFIS